MGRAARFQKRAAALLARFDERIGDDRIKFIGQTNSFNATTGEDEFSETEYFTTGVATFAGQRVAGQSGSGKTPPTQQGEVELVVTSEVEPLEGWEVVVDGYRYTVNEVQKVNYAGNLAGTGVIVYKVKGSR